MIWKSTHWHFKQVDGGVILTIGLLFLALSSVTIGVSNLVPDLVPDLLLFILFTALLFSWRIARTNLPGWIAGFLLLVIGAILTFIWVGDMWGLIYSWLQSIFGIVWQILRPPENLPLDTSLFWVSLDEIKLRVITLLTEFNKWLYALVARVPTYNYFAISLVWSYAIWLVSAWAGWMQRRLENPLIAILPAGLLLAISLGYTYGPTFALYPLLFSVLSLTGFTFYNQRERSWRACNMDYPKEERSENLMLVFSIALGFVFAAAFIPRISIRWAIESIQSWFYPQVEQIDPIIRSFGLEGDLTPLGSIGTVLEGGLPREHLIGSGPELSEKNVMSVQVIDSVYTGENFFDAVSADDLSDLAIPLYWRGITYDRYTGFGWESSEVVLQTYNADEPANQIAENYYRTLIQNYSFVESQDLIYAAGEIISLDNDYSIAWRIMPGISETLITSGDFFAGSQEKRSYRVVSSVPIVSEEQLHAAQGLYPTWVSERYLALPDVVTQRVIDLARELTSNAPTSYGKALAIESYLRTYEYELNLPAPPMNRELSDYFLFELKKGYCDYYATSMVVLARAVGVPARIAIGYTRGSYDDDNQQYIVTEDNAHSWVEIYFAGIGWIPFEPTAGQTPIQRPEMLVDLFTEVDPVATVLDTQGSSFKVKSVWWYWFGGILLASLTFPLIWSYLDRGYLRYLSPAKMVAKLYKRLYRFGRRVGSPAKVGDTPYEFAEKIGIRIRAISHKSRLESYLYPAVVEVQRLSHLYVGSIYSRQALPNNEVRNTISSWQRLSIRLLIVNILYWWQRGNIR